MWGYSRDRRGANDRSASSAANSRSAGSEWWQLGVWKVAHDAGWLHRRAGDDRQSSDYDDLRSNGYRRRWGDLVTRVSERARTNFQGDGQQQGRPPYAGGDGNFHAR